MGHFICEECVILHTDQMWGAFTMSPRVLLMKAFFIHSRDKFTSGNWHEKSELFYQNVYYSYPSTFIRFVLLRKSISTISIINWTTSYPVNMHSQECTELYLLVDNSKHAQIDIGLRAGRCDNQRSHDARFFLQSFRIFFFLLFNY